MFYFRGVFSLDASIASSKKQYCLVNKLEDFSEDEGGIATVWAMFWLILCFSISGLAVDVTNAWKVHTILQSTADISALAGVYELQARDDTGSSQTNGAMATKALAQADRYAALNMREDRYGDVLIPADIHIGYWNSIDRSFTEIKDGNYVDGPASAVGVVTRQSGENATSAVGTFFLRFVGFDRFTVKTTAIASLFVSNCDYDGMIAFGEVKLSTGQKFFDKFCVHGEKGLNAAQANEFNKGVIVSTPTFELCGQSTNKCAAPVEGETEQNPGLFDAWRAQSLFPNYGPVETNGNGGGKPTSELVGKPAEISNYIASLSNDVSYTGENYVPVYILEPDAVPKQITLSNNATLDDFIGVDGSLVVDGNLGFQPGVTYNISCGNGVNKVNLAPKDDGDWDTISRVVIVGDNCDFVFDPSVKYYDIVIATSSTSQSTFSGSSNVTLGYYDKCDDALLEVPDNYHGGAVTLLTEGSVHFASNLSAYDMQIIAAGDVHLASKAPTNKNSKGNWEPIPAEELDGSVHWGTTITTGGDISVSRAHHFHGCPGRGVNSTFFDVPLSYRLVF